MLDITKPVQTAHGYPVRLICTDRAGALPLVGLYLDKDNEEGVMTWNREGVSHLNKLCSTQNWDLVNVPPIQLKGWMGIRVRGGRTSNGVRLTTCVYDTREEAEEAISLLSPGRWDYVVTEVTWGE